MACYHAKSSLLTLWNLRPNKSRKLKIEVVKEIPTKKIHEEEQKKLNLKGGRNYCTSKNLLKESFRS